MSRLNISKLQEQLLLQTLSEASTVQSDFEDLLAAWRSGDTEKLQAMFFDVVNGRSEKYRHWLHYI